MALTEVAPGIHRQDGRLLTENLVPGTQVYGEHLIQESGTEYRAWNPHRSKLAAALRNGLTWDLPRDASVLYLGAANGTTVSHVSDILVDGVVYAVEVSPRAMRDLLEVAEDRPNVVPVLEDASQPDRYKRYVTGKVDLVYQDIAQRDQVAIFAANVDAYLAEDGAGILMVKARSVDVAADPREIFDQARQELGEAGLDVVWESDLRPFEKDHRCFVVRRG